MLYDLTVPAYANGLRALSAQLEKALAWGAANNVGELQFIAARLAPDMFPLAAQVRFTCLQAVQPLARLGAASAPALAEDAADFAGLQEQIAATLAWLDTVDAATVDADPAPEQIAQTAFGALSGAPGCGYWSSPQQLAPWKGRPGEFGLAALRWRLAGLTPRSPGSLSDGLLLLTLLFCSIVHSLYQKKA